MTILWLNEKLMQHTEHYTKRFRQGYLTKNFFQITFLFNLLLSNGRSRTSWGHLAGQSKFIIRNYLAFICGGTTITINYYEKLSISLPKYLTVCIESCGTGDISTSTDWRTSLDKCPAPILYCWIFVDQRTSDRLIRCKVHVLAHQLNVNCWRISLHAC